MKEGDVLLTALRPSQGPSAYSPWFPRGHSASGVQGANWQHLGNTVAAIALESGQLPPTKELTDLVPALDEQMTGDAPLGRPTT